MFSVCVRVCYSYGFFTYIGSNSPNVNGNIYRPYSNTFTNNLLSTPVVCKIKEADDTVITGECALAQMA